MKKDTILVWKYSQIHGALEKHGLFLEANYSVLCRTFGHTTQKW